MFWVHPPLQLSSIKQDFFALFFWMCDFFARVRRWPKRSAARRVTDSGLFLALFWFSFWQSGLFLTLSRWCPFVSSGFLVLPRSCPLFVVIYFSIDTRHLSLLAPVVCNCFRGFPSIQVVEVATLLPYPAPRLFCPLTPYPDISASRRWSSCMCLGRFIIACCACMHVCMEGWMYLYVWMKYVCIVCM